MLNSIHHNVKCAQFNWSIHTGPKPSITSVTASSSNLSVILEWQLPWQLKYQPFIRGYRIQYDTSKNATALQTTVVTTTATSFSTTIRSLAPDTTYYFRVALRASASHIGPYSAFVSARTRAAGRLSVYGLPIIPNFLYTSSNLHYTYLYRGLHNSCPLWCHWTQHALSSNHSPTGCVYCGQMYR